MVAHVQIHHATQQEVITVPITSVRKNANGEYFVWTNKGGKAHRTTVTTGNATGNRIVVLTGLQQGDVVITEGYQKLSEGMEVI